jgi:hypothetical protein
MKYKKKPLVIDAIQFISLDENKFEVCEFFKGSEFNISFHEQKGTMFIRTLEGDMTVSQGDYIIKGIKGEFYSCKPDIFEASYDKYVEPPTADEYFATFGGDNED